MRAFVALPLPEEYQQGLSRLTGKLARGLRSRVSWTKPGNWHLTLKFLGDVDPSLTDRMAEALSGLDWPGFTLQAEGGGFFPDARRPRVVWTGLVQGGEEAGALARLVDQALTPLGFEPESRPFRAHLTLGRVKRAERDDWKGVLETIRAAQWPPVQVREFVLFESVLSPQGPRYTRLGAFSVEGRGAASGDQR